MQLGNEVTMGTRLEDDAGGREVCVEHDMEAMPLPETSLSSSILMWTIS